MITYEVSAAVNPLQVDADECYEPHIPEMRHTLPPCLPPALYLSALR